MSSATAENLAGRFCVLTAGQLSILKDSIRNAGERVAEKTFFAYPETADNCCFRIYLSIRLIPGTFCFILFSLLVLFAPFFNAALLHFFQFGILLRRQYGL